METMKMRFNGVTKLLMHSEAGVNPLHPKTRALKALTSIRKKTDEIHEQIMRAEWELAMYRDDELGPVIPSNMIAASIVEGGKLSKLGTSIARSIFLPAEFFRLDYKGQRDLDGMWASNNFRDVRGVAVNNRRVMRTRPVFHPPWSVDFSLTFLPNVVNREQIVEAAMMAGQLCGIGDFRPLCGGTSGRFKVEILP